MPGSGRGNLYAIADVLIYTAEQCKEKEIDKDVAIHCVVGVYKQPEAAIQAGQYTLDVEYKS